MRTLMTSSGERQTEPSYEETKKARRRRPRHRVERWGLVAVMIGVVVCCGTSFAQNAVRTAIAQNTEQAGAAVNGVVRQAGSSASSEKAAFNSHDLSGIWRVHHGEILSKDAPPMTPWAQARYNAAKPGIGPRSQPDGNDPISACNPPGFPRILLFGAYPLEIIQLPNRLLQFYDFFYTYRTIWTDGQALPKDPTPRWYGYSVGKWDGNTLVVDSSGFDDRSWLDEDGHPHSDEMQIEERYRRVGPNKITVQITLTDPKAYTKPWVSDVITLERDTQDKMQEDLCAPADEERYKEEVKEPATTPATQQP